MTGSVQLNGWQGKTTAALALAIMMALGVAVTFTWRVFDSLVDTGAQEVEIRHLRESIESYKAFDTARMREVESRLRQDIATLGSTLSAQIDAAMQDRCFGAQCREIERRLGEIEDDIERLHPRAGRSGG
jgi:hypothetical protein